MFQHESMIDAMLTTGMLRNIAPDPIFLFGLTLLVPTNPGIRSQIEQRRLCRHSNQPLESRKGSAFSVPQSGRSWQPQPGLPCIHMGNDTAWQR
jgi:hypothetical protein